MPDLGPLLLLMVVGCAAGAINVMAGGGSALTLPALILLGLDAGTANGTNRVAILVQNISATTSFQRQGLANLKKSLGYACWAIPGAVAGTLVAVRAPDGWFERILGIVMILVVLSMVLPRRKRSDDLTKHRSRWGGPMLLGVGFYGGFIQVGVGFLFMATFYHLLHMTLVQTTVHKVIIILVYTLPTLLIFAVTGHVNWLMGSILAVGNATGAWLAARITVTKGEKAIRVVLTVAILVMAAKMLGLI